MWYGVRGFSWCCCVPCGVQCRGVDAMPAQYPLTCGVLLGKVPWCVLLVGVGVCIPETCVVGAGVYSTCCW